MDGTQVTLLATSLGSGVGAVLTALKAASWWQERNGHSGSSAIIATLRAIQVEMGKQTTELIKQTDSSGTHYRQLLEVQRELARDIGSLARDTARLVGRSDPH